MQKIKVKILFFLITGLIFSFQRNFAQAQKIYLDKNWHFKEITKKNWYKATVPGTVHTDLLANKLIPDPFYRNNETKLQWISHTNWQYQTVFNLPSTIFAQENIQLVFEGLDTYANVYLNDTLIFVANNMFRTWRQNVKPYLKQKNNLLYIVFTNAHTVADSFAKKSTVIHPCENNRNYVRKAQYHFGWDFAPKLTTCGIWRNVYLETIESNVKHKEALPKKVMGNNFGTIRLVQEKDSIGQSFYFTINNIPTFIKGANWVPADVFLPRVTKTKYRTLLIAAKQAGINMLRVWGGGVYEDDAFYTLCDSLKIMIWQDFMFAGAMYPANDDFLENIKQEAIDNITRLSKHPCIAVWCGNNEVDEAWHNWGWQKQFTITKNDSIELWQNYKKIFHELLPKLVKQYDSTRSYITSSPTNGWGRTSSLTHGDCHYWGVWWGLQPIEKYKEKVPRFMSEYGMQALPNFSSIQQFTKAADWDTSSVTMRLHQKHPTGYQNLAVYLQQNKLKPTTFKDYIMATQQLQSKALETAITAHLKAQPYCMGSMLWQFNDCYPGVTWSIVDYFGKRKKGYFTVKRLYNQ